jgi:hypothetical protein
MLSSFLAGLAGVLIAPDLSIDSVPYTLLLVAAVSAAAFGRLTSIPFALLGAVILGVGQRAIIGFSYEFHFPQSLQTGVRPALPFLALFLLLIFLPAFKGRRDVTDPLSGVDPPPPAMAHEYKDRSLAKASRVAFYVFIAAFLLIVCFAMTNVWVFRFTDAFTLAIAFLSITVFTGLGGQVSLGQAGFAGIGGYTVANLAARYDWPVLLALLVGIIVGAYFGDWAGQIEELDAGAAAEVKLKDEYVKKKQQSVNLDLYQQQLREIDSSFGALLKQLPNRSQMDALLVDINQAGLGRAHQRAGQ